MKLKPRDDPEGLIMAIDTQPIPDDVSDRERIDVKLTVFDGAGNGFSSDFRLCVDRSAIRARQRKEEMLAFFSAAQTEARSHTFMRAALPEIMTRPAIWRTKAAACGESSEDGHIAHQRGKVQRGGLWRVPREK